MSDTCEKHNKETEKTDTEKEYTWRFSLPVENSEGQPYNLTDFFAEQIIDLRSILKLYYQGNEVEIDSFSFRNEPKEIFYLKSFMK